MFRDDNEEEKEDNDDDDDDDGVIVINGQSFCTTEDLRCQKKKDCRRQKKLRHVLEKRILKVSVSLKGLPDIKIPTSS